MAEYDAGTVKATMTADSKGLHGGVEAAKKDMQSLQDEAKRVKESWRDMGVGAGISFAAITAGVWKATQANNQLKTSMIGLDTIAKGTVGTYSKVETELEKIRKDGIIPLTNATAAYKNLLTRYKDEEKAIDIFNRLADAAAFGRQGQLGLGEAIEGATSGLKNEMSQMVDNAGVTKNLSIMHKEYAASIGKTYGQLTQAEKQQAEYIGIMKETRFQVGDLAKLQNTLAGEMSKANAMTTETAAAYGDALEPALTGVTGGYSSMMKHIRDFIQTSPGMVAGVTAGAMAMTGLVAVSSAWIALDMGAKIAAGFSALTDPVGLTMIALSALTAVVVGYTTAAQKAREENFKLADRYRDEAVEVKGLIDEYYELQKIAKPTADQKQRMVDLSNQIAKILPQAVKGYDDEGNAIISVNGALREMILLKSQELRLRQSNIKDRQREIEKEQDQLESKIAFERQANLEKLDRFRDKRTGKLNAVAQKEWDDTQERIRLLNNQHKALENEKQLLINEEKAIDDLLLKGIAPSDIKSVEKIKTGEPDSKDNLLTAAVEKRKEEQLQLQNQLDIEMLERQKQFKEAELEEEKTRYNQECELAKNNAELLEQVRLGHKERMAAIDRKYAEEEKQRNQELADEIIRMTGTKEEQEELYIKRHAEQMERDGYNFAQVEDWKAAYHRQKLQEQADYQAGWIADIITRQRTLEDWWRQLMNNLVREYVQGFLLKVKAANATTGDSSFWGGLFSAIGSLFGGGAGAAVGAGVVGAVVPAAAKGMIVPAAANGMVVPPSFGTDTVLSALTPKEMVLPPDISEGLQNLIKQGNQPQQVTNNVTNNYIDAIDQQSVAQFFYKNRDHVVGIVQDDKRRGGPSRRSDED